MLHLNRALHRPLEDEGVEAAFHDQTLVVENPPQLALEARMPAAHVQIDGGFDVTGLVPDDQVGFADLEGDDIDLAGIDHDDVGDLGVAHGDSVDREGRLENQGMALNQVQVAVFPRGAFAFPQLDSRGNARKRALRCAALGRAAEPAGPAAAGGQQESQSEKNEHARPEETEGAHGGSSCGACVKGGSHLIIRPLLGG